MNWESECNFVSCTHFCIALAISVFPHTFHPFHFCIQKQQKQKSFFCFFLHKPNLHFLPDALRLSKRLNSSSQDLRFTDNFKRQQENLMFWLLGLKQKIMCTKLMFFHLLYLRAKKGIKRKTLLIFLLCAITCLASMKGQFLWKPSFEAFEAFEAFPFFPSCS